MSDKKPSTFDSSAENSDGLRLLEDTNISTETIDLKTMLSRELTTSGSFDIRGGIWATTFGKLLQALPIPALLIDRSYAAIAANQAWSKISREYETILDTRFSALFPDPSAAEQAQRLIEEVFSTRKLRISESMLEIKGSRIWGRVTCRAVRIMEDGYVLALIEDLTREKKQLMLQKKYTGRLEQEIARPKRAEDQIRASLEEKEVPLREIHRRVKNNLAVMAGLLALQSEYALDEIHRRMFDDAQARIRSTALAHELLYQSENPANLDVPEYVGGLVDHLVVSAGIGGSLIELRREVQDASFGLDTAAPFGMILKESVSNCLKHAFPEGPDGEIMISLGSIGEKEFELVVGDNGVGMPEGIDLENPQSLGLDLVHASVSQLEGEMEIRKGIGTEFRVNFKELRRENKQA